MSQHTSNSEDSPETRPIAKVNTHWQIRTFKAPSDSFANEGSFIREQTGPTKSNLFAYTHWFLESVLTESERKALLALKTFTYGELCAGMGMGIMSEWHSADLGVVCMAHVHSTTEMTQWKRQHLKRLLAAAGQTAPFNFIYKETSAPH